MDGMEVVDSPAALIAQVITMIALLIYLYTFIGCIVFREGFFRQLAYIFQLIKITLALAALLPCVLHSQLESVVGTISGTTQMALAVLAALLLNLLFAVGLHRLLDYLMLRYHNARSHSAPKPEAVCSCPCSACRHGCCRKSPPLKKRSPCCVVRKSQCCHRSHCHHRHHSPRPAYRWPCCYWWSKGNSCKCA